MILFFLYKFVLYYFPGQRQQLNLLTSYIDASNVYGSTRERQEILRLFVGGKIRLFETCLT